MPAPYETRLRRVLDYIHADPAGDMSLDTLADVAAMSRFHWHRVFHSMTGETCAQAVRRIRLHRAACWLVQSNDPVAKVAQRAGFDSVQSMGRAFRASYGMAPGAFRKRGQLASPLHQTPEQEFKMFDVTLTTRAPMRLAALPHKGPYLEIGRSFEAVGAIFTARNLWPQARGMAGLYFDDPNAVPEADLHSYAGVVLAENAPVPDGLEEVSTAGGKLAILTFKGPYSGLKNAYDYLYGVWLPKSGEEPAEAPVFEVYLNNPMDTAPDELLTEICLPLT